MVECERCNDEVSSARKIYSYEIDGFGGRVSKTVGDGEQICEDCLERLREEKNFEIKN
jgi:hypothetical protein